MSNMHEVFEDAEDLSVFPERENEPLISFEEILEDLGDKDS